MRNASNPLGFIVRDPEHVPIKSLYLEAVILLDQQKIATVKNGAYYYLYLVVLVYKYCSVGSLIEVVGIFHYFQKCLYDASVLLVIFCQHLSFIEVDTVWTVLLQMLLIFPYAQVLHPFDVPVVCTVCVVQFVQCTISHIGIAVHKQLCFIIS